VNNPDTKLVMVSVRQHSTFSRRFAERSRLASWLTQPTQNGLWEKRKRLHHTKSKSSYYWLAWCFKAYINPHGRRNTEKFWIFSYVRFCGKQFPRTEQHRSFSAHRIIWEGGPKIRRTSAEMVNGSHGVEYQGYPPTTLLSGLPKAPQC
jgi:hypothetical protein